MITPHHDKATRENDGVCGRVAWCGVEGCVVCGYGGVQVCGGLWRGVEVCVVVVVRLGGVSWMYGGVVRCCGCGGCVEIWRVVGGGVVWCVVEVWQCVWCVGCVSCVVEVWQCVWCGGVCRFVQGVEVCVVVVVRLGGVSLMYGGVVWCCVWWLCGDMEGCGGVVGFVWCAVEV